MRLNERINDLRKEIGQLTRALEDTASERVKRKARQIMSRHENTENRSKQQVLDLLKQRLAALSKRLRRYKESNQRRHDNAQFNNSERKFYTQLENKNEQQQQNNDHPDNAEVEEYWKNIWAEPKKHKRNAKWIKEEREKMRNKRKMLNREIRLEDVQKAIKKTQNWKAPGKDNIQNYWWKKFSSLHKKMAELFSLIIENSVELPKFMTEGVTHLLPKTTPTSADPSKYRPITCLPTISKIFTSIIADKICGHLDENKIR